VVKRFNHHKINKIRSNEYATYEYNQEFFMIIVNYKQAYDSINWKSLWRTTKKFEIPAKLTIMIRTCIQNSKCMIKFNDQLSKEFTTIQDWNRGGCSLPNAINYFIGKVIRKVLNIGIRVKLQELKTIKLITYADDIILDYQK